MSELITFDVCFLSFLKRILLSKLEEKTNLEPAQKCPKNVGRKVLETP